MLAALAMRESALAKEKAHWKIRSVSISNEYAEVKVSTVVDSAMWPTRATGVVLSMSCPRKATVSLRHRMREELQREQEHGGKMREMGKF